MAALLGGIIGIERQIKGKVAGLRTTMLICMGSALFMIVSLLTADKSGDKGRIAAQVVTGIGFLGAGAILHNKDSVIGLTTAATIFVVAAIGLAAGGGYWLPAAIGTLVAIFTLFLLGELETRLNARSQLFHYSLSTADATNLMNEIHAITTQYKLLLEEVELVKKEDVYKISFCIKAAPKVGQEILSRLLKTGAVASVTAPGDLLISQEKGLFNNK
jgi:putative Mg2+ transporter-C (MgtC) family protein